MYFIQVIYSTLALFIMLSLTQQSNGIFFIESWKRGDTTVQERELLFDINVDNAEFQTNIKNIAGKDSYTLKVSAGIIKIGEKSCIGGIRVYLSEIGSLPEHNNVLTTIKDPNVDCISCGDLTEVVGAFVPDGGDVGQLQFLTERVIKVEKFYCILKVKNYQFSRLSASSLNSATIQIQITNQWKCP